MSKNIIITLLILFGFTATQIQAQDVTFKSKNDSISYIIGYNIGNTFKNDSLYFNLELVKQGMHDNVYDKESVVEKTVAQALMTEFQEKLMAKYEARKVDEEKTLIAEKIKLGEDNYAKAQKFLAENKSKPGVFTTASGLQYKVITEGTGKQPTSASTVKVHYKGTLLNGTEFDSSIKRGEPIEFPLSNLIAAWGEGIPLMKVGGKNILYVKPELGYAEKGKGDIIGPNELLIFEIELIEIVK